MRKSLKSKEVMRLAWCNGVYAATRRIPRGRVATYGDIARAVGHPAAWRHVGTVLSRNHDPKTPCHRVIRSDGQAGGFGFSGGTQEKIRRLAREGVRIQNERVDLRRYRITSPRTIVVRHLALRSGQ